MRFFTNDGRTDGPSYSDARTHLKTVYQPYNSTFKVQVRASIFNAATPTCLEFAMDFICRCFELTLPQEKKKILDQQLNTDRPDRPTDGYRNAYSVMIQSRPSLPHSFFLLGAQFVSENKSYSIICNVLVFAIPRD